MDSHVVNTLREWSKKMMIALAVFMLIGAIGLIVTENIMMDDIKGDGATVCTIFAVTFWDIVRLCGFSLFVTALLTVFFELFGKAPKRNYSFVLLGTSVFGFIGSFMLSISSLLDSAKSLLMSMTYSYYNSSMDAANSVLAIINTACVFAMVSAVAVFVTYGVMASANRYMYTYANANQYSGGAPYEAPRAVWYCGGCGTQNDEAAFSCKNCGKPR